jgi:hypothetical protein
MKDLLSKYKTHLILFAAGLAIGYLVLPHAKKVEIKEIVKIERVEVIKEVESRKNNTKTRIVEHTNPDGSSSKETTIDDQDQIDKSKDSKTEESIERSKETKTTYSTTSISALAITEKNLDFTNREYGMMVTQNLTSRFNFSLLFTDKQRLGVGVGIEF